MALTGLTEFPPTFDEAVGTPGGVGADFGFELEGANGAYGNIAAPCTWFACSYGLHWNETASVNPTPAHCRSERRNVDRLFFECPGVDFSNAPRARFHEAAEI